MNPRVRAIVAALVIAALAAVAWWSLRNDAAPVGRAPRAAVSGPEEKRSAIDTGGGSLSSSSGAESSAPSHVAPRSVAMQPGSGPGGAIAGTVLDQDGRPLPSVTIRARQETAKQGGSFGTTATDGTYRIPGLEGGLYQVEARAIGLRVETLSGLLVRAGEEVRGVDFALDRGERVLGTVVDAEGKPVADAAVTARPLRGRRDADSEASGKSAADGTFEVAGLTIGKKELTASAPGFKRSDPVVVDVTARGTPRIEIKLERGAFIAGRILDASQAPIAGAKVGASPEMGRGGPFGGMGASSAAEAVSGEDGRYKIEGLGGRTFEVRATAPPSLAALAPTSRRGVKPNTTDCDLVLQAGASLSGIVVAGGDRRPIEGALVSAAIGSAGGASRVAATTGPDGAFALANLTPGDLTLEASAADRSPAQQKISVAAGEQKAGIVIELLQGGVIEGLVVTAKDRTPISGAIVRAISGGGGGGGRGRGPGEEMIVEAQASKSDLGGFIPQDQLDQMLAKNVTTDGSGHFRITGLPAGDQRVYAADAEHPGAAAKTTIKGPGDVEQVEIQLPQGGSIVGRVSDADGTPRADETVIAFAMIGRARMGTTDQTGHYAIKGLAPSAYFVSLGAEMRARGGSGVDLKAQSGGMGFAMKPANVEAGRSVEVDFGAEPQALVTGHITRGGNPVMDLGVMFFPDGGVGAMKPVSTDELGIYGVQLAAGKYILKVENVSESIEIPQGVGRIDHDVKLPSGSVTGRIVNSANGQPLRGRVQLYKSERRAADSLASVLGAQAGDTGTNQNDGTYTLSAITPGNYTITGTSDGFAMARQDGLEVPPDGKLSGIELALEPAGIIRGRVVDQNGDPVPNPMIWIVDVAASDLPSGDPPRGDEEGVFSVNRFAPGRYRVTVLSDTNAPWRQVVDFKGGTLELAPVVVKGGTLDVAVVDGSGRPVPGASVDLRYPDGERVITGFIDFISPSMPTGVDGHLRRTRLPPGPIVVNVTAGVAPTTRVGNGSAMIVNGGEQQVGVPVP